MASRQCAVALCIFAALSVRASAQTPPATPTQPSPPPEAPAAGTPSAETPAVSAPGSAAPSGPSNTTELPTINVSAPRSPPQAKPNVTPPQAAQARTCACAAVALPDWRSQRGRRNARRAANGEPDGHFRREPQLPPGGEPAEILEAAPGLAVVQHSGDGKANQYYLRGYNLDHGTDMATFWDDVPINLPTNAHGQGYTDLNFLIPETISGLEVRKGPIGRSRRFR